jgi:uncharacterized membrane protein YdbT with pleckstrin-like domain
VKPVTFRNSVRHLGGTWLTRLPPVLLVISQLDRYEAKLPWWWFEILLALFVLVAVPVLFAPVWAARFRTLTVDGDVLTLRSGWLARETRVTTRGQITSVQVDEPLSQRLSGVRALTILTSGVTSSTFTMPALLPGDAMTLERLLVGAGSQGAKTGSSPFDDAVVSSPPAGPETAVFADAVRAGEGLTVLYKAGVRDIVATSVSGGYVVVLVAAAIGAVQDVGGFLGGTPFAVSLADPRAWLLVVVAVSLVVMVLIAARFRGFRIEQTAGGELRIAYGVLERTQHTISPGQVVAVTLVRTPVDLVLGTTRLVFSTAWLTDGSRKPLVFPSMPRAVAARVVVDAVGRQIPELFVELRRWWAALPVPMMAAAVAIVLGVPAIGPWGTAAVVGGGLVLGLVVARYVLSAVSVTASDDVVCRTVGLNHRVAVYFPGTVSSVVERRVPGIPVRNVTVLGWAHRRFVHRVPVRSAYPAAEVRGALRRSVARVEASIHPTSPAHRGDL